jgi:hypothetical protein
MFGWFSKDKSASAPTLERLEKVERGLRALEDDWGEFHDKVSRQVWRNAKRTTAPALLEPEPDASTSPPAPLQRGGGGYSMTDPISARIRASRGRRTVVLGGEGP